MKKRCLMVIGLFLILSCQKNGVMESTQLSESDKAQLAEKIKSDPLLLNFSRSVNKVNAIVMRSVRNENFKIEDLQKLDVSSFTADSEYIEALRKINFDGAEEYVSVVREQRDLFKELSQKYPSMNQFSTEEWSEISMYAMKRLAKEEGRQVYVKPVN